MTRQNLSTGTTANDGTGDTLRSGATKINANFVELYKAFGGDSNILAPGIAFDSNGIIFEGTVVDANQLTLSAATLSADHTQVLPNASGNIVVDTATQTLTNKTITTPTMTNPTIEDATSSYNYNVTASALSGNRTVTLPALSTNDTITFNAQTQTLTNKTLTSPTITTPTVATHIKDTNGAILLTTTPGTSAVNNLAIENAGYSNNPKLSVEGADPNISMSVSSKGTGAVFTTKLAYDTAVMTNNGTADQTKTYIQFNRATALSATLADGTIIGEIKIFTNKNTGTATVIPTNFAQGTSFTVTQYGSAQCIWDGTNWYMVGGASAAHGYLAIT
jgi:hypothetical protein